MKSAALTCAACLMLCSGCVGPQHVVQHAPGAKTARDLRAAVDDEHARIRGIAQVEAWHGDVILSDTATPIKLVLDNQSESAVVVSLDDMLLIGSSGTLYRARAPKEISGSAPSPARQPAYVPRGSSVGHSIHDVPYGHGPEYPTIHASGPPYPPYTGQPAMIHGRFETVDLPTPEMIDSALLEGELRPGAQDVGFVYFEPLSENERSVTLQVGLSSARGETARLRFPFVVEG